MATVDRLTSLAPATPETITPRSRGFVDGIVTGFNAGIKETTGSYLLDIGAADAAKANFNALGESEIPEAVYNNPNFALRDEDIEWEPYLDLEMLTRAREAKNIQREFANQEGIGKYIAFFGGAMVDPINLIPIPGVVQAAKGASVIGRISKVAAVQGAGNAVLEASITPLLLESYKLRGQEAGISEIARNVLLAGIAGGILGGGIKGLGEIIDGARATRSDVKLDELDLPTDYFNLRNIEDRALVNANIIAKNTVTSDSFLRGLDLRRLRVGSARYVDQYGFVSSTQPELKHFKILRDDTGNITVSGNIATIIKGRQRIADKLADNEQVTIVKEDGEITFANKKDFLDNMEELKKTTEISGNKNDFDTQIYSNPGVTKNNDLKDIYIRSNADTGELDVVKITKNNKGKIIKRETLSGEERQLIFKKLHDLVAKDRDISANIARNTGETAQQTNTRTSQESKRFFDQIKTKSVINKNSVDADTEIRYANFDKNAHTKIVLQRGNLTSEDRNKLVYDHFLKGKTTDELSRLGFQYNLQTQTLTRTQPASNLTIREELEIENIKRGEDTLQKGINEHEGKLKAINCATKKGL